MHKGEASYDTALSYFKQSYDYYREGQDIKGMALALIEEGKYYDHQQKFEKANQIYNQATVLINDNDIGSLLPTINICLAEHYQNRQDYESAIGFAEQSLEEIQKQRNYEDLSTTYKILHESYAARGNYRKAYEIRSLEIVYKDSVNNSELLTNVEALRTKFEVEQKEIENELLKAEAASNQKTIQSRNITAIAFFLGFLLMLSWALIVYRTNRQNKRYNT